MLLVAAAVVAALGTALVFLYVRGADNRAEEKFETTDVLVATVQIERGERIADAAAAAGLSRQPDRLAAHVPDGSFVALAATLARLGPGGVEAR